MENILRVVKHYKPLPVLSHKSEVMRMYRKSLRTVKDWTENRDLFNIEATKIRKEFDANKSIELDSPKLNRVMRETRERLARFVHPDPYIVNYMPGGTSFMRNPAIPLEVCYPDGIPSNLINRRLNIDMSIIPDDQPDADRVFVDSVNKSYWIDKV